MPPGASSAREAAKPRAWRMLEPPSLMSGSASSVTTTRALPKS
jgi:hypothetical protein